VERFEERKAERKPCFVAYQQRNTVHRVFFTRFKQQWCAPQWQARGSFVEQTHRQRQGREGSWEDCLSAQRCATGRTQEPSRIGFSWSTGNSEQTVL
jgi:hypothetical protein